jgi:replicative DNA helicase
MQKIFEFSRGGIDPVTLIETLKENGNYDENTGKEYIFNLSRSVPSAQNIEKYCEIVKNKYILRKLIEECEEFKRIINYDEILRQREEKANEEQKHYAEVS